MGYPMWVYLPRSERAPAWCRDFLETVAAVQGLIDTAEHQLGRDGVLAALAPGLTKRGYLVESGRGSADRVRLPVLFGEQGVPELEFEVDAFHRDLGVVVEVEAGRGAQNNADIRDVVRSSLVVDAKYLALVMPVSYKFASGGRTSTTRAYENSRNQLDVLFRSTRLRLPLHGVLLVGY